MTTNIYNYLTEAFKSFKEMAKTEIFIIMIAIAVIIAFVTTVYQYYISNK